MPNITKPNDMNNVWASTGDIVAPDADYVSNGWEAIIPPREYFNWLDNRQDRFNAHVNQHGIPLWDNSTEYQANLSYSKGSNGVVYRAITTNSNVNPVGDTTGAWQQAFNTSGQQRFTTSGTFTVPNGVSTIYVSATAPGGGGGGGGAINNTINNTTAGGGGGGGAGQSSTKVAFSVSFGQTIPVTIGNPGAGGQGGTSNVRGSDGTAGGNLSVGTLLTLTGGQRGRGGEVGSGAGGQGGAPGGTWGTDGIVGSKAGDGGAGGSGPFGTAGGGGRAGQGAAPSPTAGGGYGTGGGGGGGGYSTTSTGSATIGARGSDGQPGLVIIEWS
jgi:hypothetical protein